MGKPREKVEWPATCSQADFADLIGTSSRTIRDLAGRGIVVYEGNRIRTVETMHRYLEALRKTAQGRQGHDGLDIIAERAKLTIVQREKEELALSKARGEMMDLNEVAQGWGQFGATVRSSVLAIPSKVRAAIPHITAFDAQTVDRICRDVLEMAVEELQSSPVAGSSNLEIIAPQKKRARRK